MDCYYPGREFPAVSTTGRTCQLDCRHCQGKYLEGMVPVCCPEELLEFSQALCEAGGKGMLLSGGSDGAGRVRLEHFVPAIKEVKATTDLLINAHTGLSDRGELEALVDAGIDSFSVDVYGDDETVREVLGLQSTAEDYFSVVEHLMDLGARRVAPHLCIGIRAGRLSGESAAVARLGRLSPDTLVLISLIPTRGTAFASVGAPSGAQVVSVIREARAAMPDTRLLLGCMRSRRDRSWEADAVLAGVDGIVLPSESTVRALSGKGYELRKKNTCCALR